MSKPVIGVMDSGLGLVDFADALHARLPQADLVLAMDPDNAPYGRLTHEQVIERAVDSAGWLAQWSPDAIVVACNTASVNALEALRDTYEHPHEAARPHAADPAGWPGQRSAPTFTPVPIIGTVPAIKVAAQARAPFAVWATTATTHSSYQRRLVQEFVADAGMDPAYVYQVACPGLSRAIDAADADAIDAAIRTGAEATPDSVENIVLGCTHYGLVADRIGELRPQTKNLFDSPAAVAQQTARRIGAAATPATAGADQGENSGTGRILATYMSGRLEPLPAAVGAYPAGRRLLAMGDAAGTTPATPR